MQESPGIALKNNHKIDSNTVYDKPFHLLGVSYNPKIHKSCSEFKSKNTFSGGAFYSLPYDRAAATNSWCEKLSTTSQPGTCDRVQSKETLPAILPSRHYNGLRLRYNRPIYIHWISKYLFSSYFFRGYCLKQQNTTVPLLFFQVFV